MPDDSRLELSIQIAAKPATVFRFLSDPKLFQQWMGTGAILGARDLTVQYPGGDIARGTIREAVPDKRLAFGWGYEQGTHGLLPDSTLVTIDLEATADGGTLVRLTHSNLNQAQQAEHAKGWNYYLSQLGTHAASIGIAEKVPEVVAAYCQAWNETDPGRRKELLDRCWESDGAFRDQMGAADSAEALSAYIGGAHQFVPGFQLESSGRHDLVHGYVRFPWLIRLPDGKVMSRGTNFGQLSANGKFRFVTGFWDG